MQLHEPETYGLAQQMRSQVTARLEADIAARMTGPTEGCPDGIRVIPLYFHILHHGGSSQFTGNNNFTVAEIQQAIDRVNMYFQGTTPYMNRVPDRFIDDGSAVVNSCIQFCWNPADVNRVNVWEFPLRQTVLDSAHKIRFAKDVQIASPLQNKCEYVNVYVGNYGITETGTSGNLGYSMHFLSTFAGVRVDDNVFVPNSFITNAYDTLGVTLTHELGHYLGLSHTWGPSNLPESGPIPISMFCGIDDDIADTPNQGRDTDGTGPGMPTYTLEEDVIQCGNPVMYTNFMTYSRSDWMVNFTYQQAARMRLHLEELENIVQSSSFFTAPCSPNLGFLRGTDYCQAPALACKQPLANIPNDTVRVCGNQTVINLNARLQQWGYNTGVSPATDYIWHIGAVTGPHVPFPAKTKVTATMPVCTPDTFRFALGLHCASTGTVQTGGTLTVLTYLTPEQLMERYLRNGDCQDGPGPVYTEADLAAGCDGLMTFTPVFSPLFPVTVSGTMTFDAQFSPSILGPCCTSGCDRQGERSYSCHEPAFACTGLAFSGGVHLVELNPCPGHDLDATFEGYETSSVSILDPNGLVSGFYYFADEGRTEFFDPQSHYFYEGNGCEPGNTVTIHSSLGCDTDADGQPNFYVNVGTVTFSQIAPPPSAPALLRSINGDSECSYAWLPACTGDGITPSPLPILDCGSGPLPDVQASVMNEFGCVAEHTVAQPACPECPPLQTDCGPMNFNGGMEEVCSGNTLANGFPNITVAGVTVPSGTVFWSRGPMGMPGVPVYVTQAADAPDDLGPVLVSSNPTSGLPQSVIFFANVLCDHDLDPATPPVHTQIGSYEAVILPVPHARMVPVCRPGYEEQFHVEVEVLSNNTGAVITATNSLDNEALTFTAPGIQYFGPFDNSDTVFAQIAFDPSCPKKSGPLTANCEPGWCAPPSVTFRDTCMTVGGNELFFVGVMVSGQTTELLFDVTSTLNNDTAHIEATAPMAVIGPVSGPVQVTVSSHTYPSCATSSGIIPNPCLLTDVPDEAQASPTLLVHPVPTSDAVTVSAVGFDAMGMLILTDVLGRRLRTMPFGPGELQEGMTVQAHDLAPGVYLIMAADSRGLPVAVVRMVRSR